MLNDFNLRKVPRVLGRDVKLLFSSCNSVTSSSMFSNAVSSMLVISLLLISILISEQLVLVKLENAIFGTLDMLLPSSWMNRTSNIWSVTSNSGTSSSPSSEHMTVDSVHEHGGGAIHAVVWPVVCWTAHDTTTRKTTWRKEVFRINQFKVRKVAKIRNRYNQVPHLTQDT